MSIAAVVHIQGEDAFLADMDDFPNPMHSFVVFRNIRKRDGKPLAYVTDGATAFLYPWSRITFIETIGDVPEMAAPRTNGAGGTTILGFFREDDKQS